MASAIDAFRERIVMCTDSGDAFKVMSPDLLKEISTASKPMIQSFFKVMSILIEDAEESPGTKFYSLYLLLRASETNPTAEFIAELDNAKTLVNYIFYTAQTDMDKDCEVSERGRNYFLRNPNPNEAYLGINFVRLCLEAVIYWGKYFGKKDPSDPRHGFYNRLERVVKRAPMPSSYRFVGKEYQGRGELSSWDFENFDNPSVPYKPADNFAVKNIKSESVSEVEREKEKEKAVINIKKVGYDDDQLSRNKSESKSNLDKVLKTEESMIKSPMNFEYNNLSPIAHEKTIQLSSAAESRAFLDKFTLKSEKSDPRLANTEHDVKLGKYQSSQPDRDLARYEEALKKHNTTGAPISKTATNMFESQSAIQVNQSSPMLYASTKTGNEALQKSRPNSRVLEENPSRSKSPSLISDRQNLRGKQHDLDTSIQSTSSKGDFQGRDLSQDKKATFGSRMAQLGVFSEDKRAPIAEIRKKSRSPTPTNLSEVVSGKSSPQKREGSPMNIKASTDNIRNFFNERDKPQQPNRLTARAWETSQPQSKTLSPDNTPQFIHRPPQSDGRRTSKSPTVDSRTGLSEKLKNPDATFGGTNLEASINNTSVNASIGRRGPVVRGGVEAMENESNRGGANNQNAGEPSSNEAKILALQVESFRKENQYLMNEIQRYQAEFKRRMDVEKLLVKESNHLKAIIASSNQKMEEQSATMIELYDKNKKLTKELLEARRELDMYRDS